MKDLISREAAIQALNDCLDIKGHAYISLHDSLMEIPSSVVTWYLSVGIVPIRITSLIICTQKPSSLDAENSIFSTFSYLLSLYSTIILVYDLTIPSRSL